MKELWLARDEDGEIYLYITKPFKNLLGHQWTLAETFSSMPTDWFPEVQWSDEEPTKVKLEIIK